MAGGANAAFKGGIEVIPARQLVGIDLREGAVEFEEFAQFFDDVVILRGVRNEKTLPHWLTSCLRPGLSSKASSIPFRYSLIVSSQL